MKYLSLAILCLGVMACKSSTSSSISPIQAVGCDIETAVIGAEAGAIATLLTCANQTQISTDLQTALGNANLCAQPGVAAVSMPQLKAKASAKPMGIIGNIACPLVINVAIGYATQAVPASWSCTTGASAASLAAALTAACETAVPL